MTDEEKQEIKKQYGLTDEMIDFCIKNKAGLRYVPWKKEGTGFGGYLPVGWKEDTDDYDEWSSTRESG